MENRRLDSKVETKRSSAAETKLGTEHAGEVMIPPNPRSVTIAEGFSIKYMNMRDADSGRLMWESTDFAQRLFEEIKDAHIPKEILQCKAVSREICFSSREEIKALRIAQNIFFHDRKIEVWSYDFGFVIPNSTNTWQNSIYAAEVMVFTPKDLSGNIRIESCFYDGASLIAKSLVRVFYD